MCKVPWHIISGSKSDRFLLFPFLAGRWYTKCPGITLSPLVPGSTGTLGLFLSQRHPRCSPYRVSQLSQSGWWILNCTHSQCRILTAEAAPSLQKISGQKDAAPHSSLNQSCSSHSSQIPILQMKKWMLRERKWLAHGE